MTSHGLYSTLPAITDYHASDNRSIPTFLVDVIVEWPFSCSYFNNVYRVECSKFARVRYLEVACHFLTQTSI